MQPYRLHVAAAALVLSALLSGPAAAITEEEASRRLSEAYNVEVLKVAPGDLAGRAVWLVTVMNRGGAFNEAFMVTTLAVDRESGELVSSFDSATGRLPPVLGGSDRDQQQPARARGGIWR